ncbi:MFS transporter [Corynebacterium mendelii]|uniref:MFS transporter n=1 Tax=Corynebacterium mendelii TaxID=2765362 RepID=A0A939E3W9_9CORY|nr:MFS transporter [Corynebacterium mendelii]MBN9645147.1 MFS transporter [Corynebacterium mendelii]
MSPAITRTRSPRTASDSSTAAAGQSPATRWYGLVVLALGLAMIVIDGTIVGVALPTIMAEMSLSITDAQWVNALYSVVFAALLLTMGRLADRYGRRGFFLAGIVVFAAGSVLAARSSGVEHLVSARVVQGVGGAMILPATLSTVNATFRGGDRAAAFGVWGAVMSGAAAVGPLLGGWLTSSFGWRWIFWVNLPLAAVVLVGAVVWVCPTRGSNNRRGIDVDGTLLSAIGFGALVFGIIEGPAIGWWTPIQPLSFLGHSWPEQAEVSAAGLALVIGAGALALFIAWEIHRKNNRRDAILELELFTIPTFTWGNIAAFAVAVGEFGIVFLLPLFLVGSAGLSVMQSGWVLAAMALGAFFSGASARHLAARTSAPVVVVIGLALEVTGCVVLALTIGLSGSLWLISALLVIYGLGLGLASAQLTSTVLSDVPKAASGQGSATQSTIRQIGSAVGAAVSGAALQAHLPDSLAGGLEQAGFDPDHLTPVTRAVEQSAGGALTLLRSGHTFPGMAEEQTGRLIDALSTGYAGATGWALAVCTAFLALGLVAAVTLAANSTRRQPTPAGNPGA